MFVGGEKGKALLVEPRIVLDEICDPEVEGNKPLELMLVGPLGAFSGSSVRPMTDSMGLGMVYVYLYIKGEKWLHEESEM